MIACIYMYVPRITSFVLSLDLSPVYCNCADKAAIGRFLLELSYSGV